MLHEKNAYISSLKFVSTQKDSKKKSHELGLFQYQEKPRKVYYNSKKHIGSGETP